MARNRRKVEAFGLSFLDCICCGFGAVLLIYVYLTADSSIAAMNKADDLNAEVSRLEEEIREGRQDLVVLRNTIDKTTSETASAQAREKQIRAEMESRREQLSTSDAASLARNARVEKLRADVRALEVGNRRLEGGSVAGGPTGQQTTAFRQTGGDRRYITGLRLRGSRVLILVDASASMLHHDLVTIIRLRNSPVAKRRDAAKWRRAVETATWLATQLPASGQYQIWTFNTKVQPLLPESAGRWHAAADADTLARNLQQLRLVTPGDGTNLQKVFVEARRLNPAPDQIVLITDGLPTQGLTPSSARYINAEKRIGLFKAAVKDFPPRIPLDVVLLPLKGEQQAAYQYWRLALATGGSLLMPSKDWP